MSIFDWLVGSRETDKDDGPFDPRRAGSMIIAVGGPGTGKTLLSFRLAMLAGFRAGLPLVAQDTNGDVGVYHRAAISRLRRKSNPSEHDREVLEYLTDDRQVRIYPQSKAGQFADMIEGYRKRASKDRNRRARLFAFIDEGGMIRRDNESFWNMAASFRNSGITAYTTVHKDTDITRVGRQAIRAAMLFQGYEGTVNFFGVDIEAKDCTPAGSDYVIYMDHERTLKRWDHGSKWSEPPFELIAPVQPTNIDPSMVKV